MDAGLLLMGVAPGLSVDALLRARMHAQRLSGDARIRGIPADVARSICAVQAQQLDAGMLSLGVRSSGLTASQVAHAHGPGRSLVRTWLMRGTLHLVAADDARWLLGVYGPLNAARDATRRAQTGLSDDLCERAMRVIRRALSEGPLTRHDLRERLAAKGVALPEGQALIHLLALAASQGVLVLTEQVGRYNTFTLLDDVVPRERRTPTGERAQAELARRYLRAYAPATLADFRYWSGLPMSVARRAFAAIAAELEEVAGPLPGLQRLKAEPIVEASSPAVSLLPYFDTYLLGYRHRAVMIEPAWEPRIYNGGWINPTLCVDGRLQGTWRIRSERRSTVLEVTPFGRQTRAVAGLVRAAGAEASRFLDADARLELRSVTPADGASAASSSPARDLAEFAAARSRG